MSGFSGMGAKSDPKKRQTPDCTCWTCDKDIHHLGVMSHRAMHRRKGEDCRITYSSGKTYLHKFSKTS